MCSSDLDNDREGRDLRQFARELPVDLTPEGYAFIWNTEKVIERGIEKIDVVEAILRSQGQFDYLKDKVKPEELLYVTSYGEFKDFKVYMISLSRDILRPQFLGDRKSTRLNSSHIPLSRMPSSA